MITGGHFMEFFAYITPLLIIYVLDVLLKQKVSYNLPVVINPSQYIWTGEEQGLSRSFKRAQCNTTKNNF